MNPITFIGDLISMPFGALMKILYDLFNNYALAILFFAIVVKIVLLPLGIKQQQSQIKMAKIKPKEQAIRGKYAGRTDSATQQKVQAEVLEMYKKENYSPFGGCLPMLIQLPILFALYGIIRNSLNYTAPVEIKSLIEGIQQYIYDNIGTFSETIKSLANIPSADKIDQFQIIKVLSNSDYFAVIRENFSWSAGIADTFQNIVASFKLFGQSVVFSPSELMDKRNFIFLTIPVVNFAVSFLQMRLQKIINAKTMAADAANNNSMKVMEYMMPLLIVWMSFTMPAALGLYWIFQSALGIVQTLVLSKLYPIPVISEEEYELARQQYGTAKKKKKKKPVADELDDEDDVIDSKFLSDGKNGKNNGGGSDDDNGGDPDDEKYISKTIPKGINPNVKNNYQKTGKKYTIKKRKK